MSDRLLCGRTAREPFRHYSNAVLQLGSTYTNTAAGRRLRHEWVISTNWVAG